jgi:hypothetical protein
MEELDAAVINRFEVLIARYESDVTCHYGNKPKGAKSVPSHFHLVLLAVGLATCAQTQVPDDIRPNFVSVGMTVAQVDALMGAADKTTCWRYKKDGWPEQVFACFEDGKVGVRRVLENEPEPKPPDLKGSETPDEVQRLWGEPTIVVGIYTHPEHVGIFVGEFSLDKLINWSFVPSPPPPRLH